MATAKITLSSFYSWFEMQDDDLFKNLELPDGIDKDTLTGNILMRGGEFETLYGDPDFIQSLIGIWGKKWYKTFERWITALSLEYNPLENYDRIEDWTEERGNSGTETTSGSETSSGTLDRTTKDNTTNERKVSAFDSSDYQPSEENISKSDGSVKDKTGDKTETSGSTSTTFDEGVKHSGRLHGNIGVTTSQQMLESELKIAEWNIYEHITDLFLSEFVIPIYS